MATIKSYTSLEQSKKLAEILPPESADMIYYWFDNSELNDEWYELSLGTNRVNDKDVYAWSLGALLDILPRETGLLKSATDDTYHCGCIDKWYDSPVDACYEMILKLKGNNML